MKGNKSHTFDTLGPFANKRQKGIFLPKNKEEKVWQSTKNRYYWMWMKNRKC